MAPLSRRSARQLVAAATEMLRAGALATHRRVGYHGARHGERANRLLERAEPPRAEGGEVTAGLSEEPGRGVLVTLLAALRALRRGLDGHRDAGELTGLDRAVEEGACQELTESLVRLLKETDTIRIRVRWSPPGPSEVEPEPELTFTRDDLAPLQLAGQRYVRDEPAQPVRVTGQVVRLRRAEADGPGSVRLRVLEGAEVEQVRMGLDPDAYGTAVRAHLRGVPIRVSGTLESRSGFRRITGAHAVALVE
ncbi:hypothetical protein [Streptomyces sp. NPDC005438]|uniref:hypothetical protein n=1 Tax=Streptomyces sp. NPDC005438 TaxID=3156880 RepID=UPI0033A3716F